jgi:hypothetical protein
MEEEKKRKEKKKETLFYTRQHGCISVANIAPSRQPTKI